MSDDVSSFAIHQALTANPSADGTHVILELTTAGENLPISIPIQALGPMVALLSQAARLAYVIAGSVPNQPVLETDNTAVFCDERNVDIHFRLVGGLDLPLGLTLEGAAKLGEQLFASLAKDRPTAH
jgi:hypothetical protein